MQRDDLDPLDTQNPSRRAKERFRAGMAAALLLDFVFSEIREKQPSYFSDLYHRLRSGFDYIALLKADGGYDGNVPIHDEQGGIDYWIHEDHLRSMLDVYFPHGPGDAPRLTDGRALVVLILHSALETLATDINVPRTAGQSAVAAVSRHLYMHEQAREMREVLVDLRETRNLIAHNSGIVNDQYLRLVRGSPLSLGEDRALSDADIKRFAEAVRWAADGLTAGV